MSAPLVTIRLSGEPQGKGRPRFARASGRAFTPASTRSYEAALKYAAQMAMEASGSHGALVGGQIAVFIRADMPIPVSKPKAFRRGIEAGCIRPTTKPDVDNIAKNIDALNGIVWADDKQVVSLTIEKHYSDTPALTIEVRSA